MVATRWIPVGESSPGHGDTVWVYDGTDVFMGEWWGQSGFQSYGASCDREGLNSETLLDITHWREIETPEPPAITRDALREQWDKMHGK